MAAAQNTIFSLFARSCTPNKVHRLAHLSLTYSLLSSCIAHLIIILSSYVSDTRLILRGTQVSEQCVFFNCAAHAHNKHTSKEPTNVLLAAMSTLQALTLTHTQTHTNNTHTTNTHLICFLLLCLLLLAAGRLAFSQSHVLIKIWVQFRLLQAAALAVLLLLHR